MTIPIDPAAIRAALERQYALLLPVRQHLQTEVAPGWIVVDDEWTGQAAESARRLVAELVKRVAEAADGVDDQIRVLRERIAAHL